MSHQSNLIETDILGYLKDQEHKSLLRFITCGSVDDGKSTLIGRLLYESKLIYEDQLATLKKDSSKVGTQGDDIDFALLVDGLASEREQGITIDVAYRYFSTDKRKFIVADTPGHEQYTRNMATGASTAELAILMVDARHGIMTQTRRHSTIVHMLGVDKIVLAINKMDLVDYEESTYQKILDDYRTFATELGIRDFTAIPVSALKGDNITDPSEEMAWYSGPSLIEFLETVPLKTVNTAGAFTMPVQWVNRPNLDFRGFAGQITTGKIAVGDAIEVLPAKVRSTVKSIVTFEKEAKEAIRGESVTLTLNDEIDISRGDVLVCKGSKTEIGHSFVSTLLWMSEEALVPGKSYWIKTRAKLLSGTIQAPRYRLNVNTLEKSESETLSLNEIGQCECEFDQDIAYEPYTRNPHLGSFIIIDRQSNNTVGMGLIEDSIGHESWAERHVSERNKYWSKGIVSYADRVKQNKHKSLLIVLTGEVAREQYSNIGTALEKQLCEEGIRAYRYGFQFMRIADTDKQSITELRQDMFRHLLDIGYAFLDAGMVFITSIRNMSRKEAEELRVISKPFDVVIIDLDKQTSIADRVCSDFDTSKESLIADIVSRVKDS
ncbi:sulfate adenylyltransferase subunit CysN [Candidatus Marinamargulisbacteria bacterium SCGC AG-343-D04]|nr:sulfate adenylyltransferase subunit CysN [Candidatus Marinamargulisbacteria bacterium SCGC AG-343-D04]